MWSKDRGSWWDRFKNQIGLGGQTETTVVEEEEQAIAAPPQPEQVISAPVSPVAEPPDVVEPKQSGLNDLSPLAESSDKLEPNQSSRITDLDPLAVPSDEVEREQEPNETPITLLDDAHTDSPFDKGGSELDEQGDFEPPSPRESLIEQDPSPVTVEHSLLEEAIAPELHELETQIDELEPIAQVEEPAPQPEVKKESWFDKLNKPIDLSFSFGKSDETEDEDGEKKSWLGRFKDMAYLGLGRPDVEQAAETEEVKKSWYKRFQARLKKTQDEFVTRLQRVAKGRTKIDEDMLEEIEEILLSSDVGVATTDDVITHLRSLAKEKRFYPEEVMPALAEYLKAELQSDRSHVHIEPGKLNILLMVGVNGVGKTTTTGKIAAKLRISGYSVMMAAADTFRAAAIDQLAVWSRRAEVDIISHQEGSDPAAVVFDAIQAAKARQIDVLIIDTAGRLHNKANLMEEMRKIRRVIDREAPDSPVESMIVLDATTGQNGLRQAEVFREVVKLNGIILTKLDGTAKGGVIFAIKRELSLPIKLIGIGEGLEDLREFEPELFVQALFSEVEEHDVGDRDEEAVAS